MNSKRGRLWLKIISIALVAALVLGTLSMAIFAKEDIENTTYEILEEE